MREWWESRWLRRHAIFAPFGIFAAVALLTWWSEAGQWRSGETLQAAAKLVDLAAVLYGMAAVLSEKGVDTMFWALEQREKRREKLRAEGQAEGRAEGQAEGRAEGQAEGRAEGQAEGRAEGQAEVKQRYVAHLERVSREKGIPLVELLPSETEG